MHFKFAVTVALYFLSVVSAATYNITVGENDEVDYKPRFLTDVRSGDTIHFSFVSIIPHSITESTFEQPCTRKQSGSDSGVISNTTSPSVWSTTIADISGPMWFYCTVGTHCSTYGMVFAINPTSNQTFDAFQAKAIGATSSSVGGGSSTSRNPSATSSGSPSPSSSTSADIKISIHKLTVVFVVAGLFARSSL